MSNDKIIFDLFRRKKAEWSRTATATLTQAEVDELNAVLQAAREPQEDTAQTTAVGMGAKFPFFASLRASLGSMSQGQIDGFNRLIHAMTAARWPISWVAYGLATPWWETNKQMCPVSEGYYLGEERAKRFQRTLRYYPWHGRGDVQLTWEKNYRRADDELGLGGRLVRDPELALDPDISAQILVKGMEQGWFTGKSLKDYLPLSGLAGHSAFKKARRIINGNDKSDEIATIARKIQDALVAGEWK